MTPPPTQTRSEEGPPRPARGFPGEAHTVTAGPAVPLLGARQGEPHAASQRNVRTLGSRQHRSHHARQGGDPGVRGRVRGEAQEGSPDTGNRVDGPGRRHADSSKTVTEGQIPSDPLTSGPWRSHTHGQNRRIRAGGGDRAQGRKGTELSSRAVESSK